jgi:hypothetical protein
MVHCHGIWTWMGLWAFDPFSKLELGLIFKTSLELEFFNTYSNLFFRTKTRCSSHKSRTTEHWFIAETSIQNVIWQ